MFFNFSHNLAEEEEEEEEDPPMKIFTPYRKTRSLRSLAIIFQKA